MYKNIPTLYKLKFYPSNYIFNYFKQLKSLIIEERQKSKNCVKILKVVQTKNNLNTSLEI